MAAPKIAPPLRLMLDIEAWKDETQLMTAAERGALLALKMFFWRTGPLPDDDAVLARIVGMEVKDWRKTRKALEPQFIVKCGEWLREDWNTELEEAYAAVNRVKELSRKGNAARWGKAKNAASDHPAGNPAGTPTGIPHEIRQCYPGIELKLRAGSAEGRNVQPRRVFVLTRFPEFAHQAQCVMQELLEIGGQCGERRLPTS